MCFARTKRFFASFFESYWAGTSLRGRQFEYFFISQPLTACTKNVSLQNQRRQLLWDTSVCCVFDSCQIQSSCAVVLANVNSTVVC